MNGSPMVARFADWSRPDGRRDLRLMPMVSACIVVDLDREAEPVIRATIRQSARGSTVHCALWVGYVEGIGSTRYGFGRAGGYGYCKASAALQDAIDKAGIALSERIDGRGEDAMRRALLAIAAAAGWNRVSVVTA